ncbi:Chromosome partition protein Smc [Bremerella volcania]|uniref:Chromosome partition protein Smc n=2 Tax=Bremerella volcania TaxID=2527984 RepID=A0A518CCS7_9BACT|nr:Chromosome partition protein Smc [Bremerella volcania]
MSPDYAPLDQALTQLRHHNGELEKFIDQLLQEIANLGQEVESRASELMKARREIDQTSQVSVQAAQENLRLSQQVVEREDALNRANAEITQLREQLSEAKLSPSSDPASQQRIAELEKQLQASRSQAEPDADLLAEVEQLRRDLAATKLELMRRDEAHTIIREDADHDSLVERNQALEGELHQARGHAMQLTETIDQQRKELNQQKSAWSEELQAMRSLLERRTAAPAQTAQTQSFADTSVISDTATVCRDEVEYRANNNNTVVDSVMAQFAKLQRDVNKRRSQRR